jgi:hypothetical protein
MLLQVLLQLEVDYPSQISLVLFCSQQQREQKQQQEDVPVAGKLQVSFLFWQLLEDFPFQEPIY